MNILNFLNTIPRSPKEIQKVTIITHRRDGKTFGMSLFLKQELLKGVLQIGVVVPSMNVAGLVLRNMGFFVALPYDENSIRFKNLHISWGRELVDFKECDLIFIDEPGLAIDRSYLIPTYKPFTVVALTSDKNFLAPDEQVDLSYNPDKIYVTKSYV